MSIESYRGAVPEGFRYDRRHDMWVRLEGDEVIIGATGFGLHRAGAIIGYTAKPRGAEVECGRGLGTVECAKTVLAVRAPVSMVLLQANEAAEERPDLLNRDPHGQGWMVRGRPTRWAAEQADLVDATAYRAHILSLDPRAELL